ncbi:BamA/TamA family outer membrane protein [candidate division KSB1 bacterium]|nr:BamA/TamA family outer membrane protein [candidate division KSB1 bacterium]
MRNIRIAFIILLMFSVSRNCLAQQDTSRIEFSTIRIQGNRQLSAREIQKIIPPGKYSTQQLKSLVIQLLEKYRQKGFYFVKIEPKDTTNQLLLDINEGPELLVSKLNIIAKDSSLENEIQSLLDSRKRGTVEEAIKFNAEQILDYLDENGYPFGEISIDSLIIASNPDESKILLECHLGLHTGPPVTIDSIIVQGNSVTKPHVITREMRLQRGEIYNQQRINRSQNRLQRTGLLNQVDEPQIFLDSQGHGVLLVNVKEGNPNQLNAVLGYNPATNNREKGYVTGLIDVAFRNLLGTGRVVEAFWQKKDQRSQELRFHYVEPWVRGYPIHVGTGFQQTIQDTTFIRRNLSLEVDFPISDILSLQANIGKEDVLPDSFGQILYQLPRSNSLLTRIGFQYDTRDNLWNPARGLLYQTQYEYARKRVSAAPYVNEQLIETGDFRRDRWLVDLELYVPTFRWQTILMGLHGRQVKSNESAISISDLFRFGGTNSVRGYREEEFSGEKIAWLNLEYRYLLAPRSRVFLFLDGGYFYQKNQDKNFIEDYKIGYGFGVRIETRLGIMGIDYGLGQGRGLTSGFVHVGLTNRF